MEKDRSKKPLYKQLMYEIENEGYRFPLFFSQTDDCNTIVSDENEFATMLPCESLGEYTALAVNNLVPVAEALEGDIKRMVESHATLLNCYNIISNNCPSQEALTDLRTEMYNLLQQIHKAKEALNKIS